MSCIDQRETTSRLLLQQCTLWRSVLRAAAQAQRVKFDSRAYGYASTEDRKGLQVKGNLEWFFVVYAGSIVIFRDLGQTSAAIDIAGH